MKQKRQAFTLVEIMVGMTLTIFVMTILSDAFAKSLETFSALKAIGDLQDNLRVASRSLRDDLEEDHFDGMRRASDPGHWTDRPRSGFVVIYQDSVAKGAYPGGVPSAPADPTKPYVFEGNPDGIPSFRAWDHQIWMTVKRKGNHPKDFFSAMAPATVPLPAIVDPAKRSNIYGLPADATLRDTNSLLFTSQWAVVGYFLVRKGTTESNKAAADDLAAPGATSVPTFTLYRCELVVVPDPKDMNAQAWPASPGNIAAFKKFAWLPDAANNMYFPSPDELASKVVRPINYLDVTPAATAAAQASVIARSTVVLNDVISFQVQALHYFPAGNFDWPLFADVEGGVFDTGSPTPYQFTVNSAPPVVQKADAVLKGVAITIRVWDRGQGIARQVTVIQDM